MLAYLQSKGAALASAQETLSRRLAQVEVPCATGLRSGLRGQVRSPLRHEPTRLGSAQSARRKCLCLRHWGHAFDISAAVQMPAHHCRRDRTLP